MLLLNSCSQYISAKIVFYLFTCGRKKMVLNKCYLTEYICPGGTRVVCIKTFILQYYPYRTFLYSVVQQGCYKKCYLIIESLSPDYFLWTNFVELAFAGNINHAISWNLFSRIKLFSELSFVVGKKFKPIDVLGACISIFK